MGRLFYRTAARGSRWSVSFHPAPAALTPLAAVQVNSRPPQGAHDMQMMMNCAFPHACRDATYVDVITTKVTAHGDSDVGRLRLTKYGHSVKWLRAFEDDGYDVANEFESSVAISHDLLGDAVCGFTAPHPSDPYPWAPLVLAPFVPPPPETELHTVALVVNRNDGEVEDEQVNFVGDNAYLDGGSNGCDTIRYRFGLSQLCQETNGFCAGLHTEQLTSNCDPPPGHFTFPATFAVEGSPGWVDWNLTTYAGTIPPLAGDWRGGALVSEHLYVLTNAGLEVDGLGGSRLDATAPDAKPQILKVYQDSTNPETWKDLSSFLTAAQWLIHDDERECFWVVGVNGADLKLYKVDYHSKA